MKTKTKTRITIIDDADEYVEVTGIYHPGLRGKRDRFGVQLEPDDEPEFEILNAVDQHGNTRNLSKTETLAALQELWDSFN